MLKETQVGDIQPLLNLKVTQGTFKAGIIGSSMLNTVSAKFTCELKGTKYPTLDWV